MNASQITESLKSLHSEIDRLYRGEVGYHLNRLQVAHDLLVKEYAPFLVNDRVELAKTPVIDSKNSWGWMCYKHFLVEGVRGTVTGVEVLSDGLRFSVVFDNFSIKSYDGKITTPKESHAFRLKVKDLRPIQYKPGESIDLFNG